MMHSQLSALILQQSECDVIEGNDLLGLHIKT